MRRGDGDRMSHEEAWDLIPWYVTGTLGDAETRRLEAHAQRCAACKTEIAARRVLRDAHPSERAPEDGGADRPAAGSVWGGLRARLDGAPGLVLGVLGVLALGLALLLQAMPRAEYAALNDAAAAGDPELRLLPDPDADPAMVEAALGAVGATVTDRSDPSGLLRARIASAARADALDALRASALFLVVAADTPPAPEDAAR